MLLRSTWALGVALQNRWGCGDDAGGAEMLGVLSCWRCSAPRDAEPLGMLRHGGSRDPEDAQPSKLPHSPAKSPEARLPTGSPIPGCLPGGEGARG